MHLKSKSSSIEVTEGAGSGDVVKVTVLTKQFPDSPRDSSY